MAAIQPPACRKGSQLLYSIYLGLKKATYYILTMPRFRIGPQSRTQVGYMYGSSTSTLPLDPLKGPRLRPEATPGRSMRPESPLERPLQGLIARPGLTLCFLHGLYVHIPCTIHNIPYILSENLLHYNIPYYVVPGAFGCGGEPAERSLGATGRGPLATGWYPWSQGPPMSP